jgi:branched-chain amino acid transport system substrate-binding protein
MMITATGPGLVGDHVIPGAEAAVAAVNAAGGIDGRDIKLEVCDSHGSPNQASACAQKAVTDKSIVATVGNNDYVGGGPVTGVLKGKLAALALKPYTPPDFASKIGFATDCGGIGIQAGMAESLAAQGAKKIVVLFFDTPGGHPGLDFLTAKVEELFPPAKVLHVGVPRTASDMTSYAAQAISQNPDGVVLSLTEPLAVASIKQLRAQGYKGKIQAPATMMTASAIKQIGDPNNIKSSGCYSYDSAGYKSYRADMTKYQPSESTSDEGLNAWLGVKSFVKVMKGKDLTRQKVLDTYNATSSLDTDGLTGPIDFTKENKENGFARLFSPAVVDHEIKNGEQVDVAPVTYLNIFTGKATGGN